MNLLNRWIPVFFACFLSAFAPQPDADLPKIFVLGTHEKAYESLLMQHQTLLLQVCNNNMSVAHGKWISMNQEMESFAGQLDLDFNGVSLWVHAFFKPDGTIHHLGFYLKPESRNVPIEKLTDFFDRFVKHYKLPLQSNGNYSHYGVAFFPTMPRKITQD